VSIVAVDFAAVIGGVVILEQVFGWTGMCRMLLEGVTQSDTNVVLAWLTVTATVVVAFNLVADVVLARLDPRIRRD
jgi:peptide/nickel transport system permease protein